MKGRMQLMVVTTQELTKLAENLNKIISLSEVDQHKVMDKKHIDVQKVFCLIAEKNENAAKLNRHAMKIFQK